MSNEVEISIGLLEEILVAGYQTPYVVRVISGPGPDARIIGVRWKGDRVAFVYDRPVGDIVLQQLIGT